MLRNVFLKTLRDQRRSLIWWSAGLVAITVMTMLFYPSFQDVSGIDEIFEQIPEPLAKMFAGEFSDLTSPEGFLNSQLFFLVLPLVFLVFAVAQGSSAIAGEEERGTLDVLLSNPLSRSRVVVEKYAAMIVATLALALVAWVGFVIGAVIVEMEISFLRIAEATLSAALLGIAFGGFSLAVGSARGKRGLSIGVASALGVVAYFVNALAPLVDVLEPLTKLSPFYYYIGADPLTNGLNPAHVAVLVGLTLAFLAVAVTTIERRDLGVG